VLLLVLALLAACGCAPGLAETLLPALGVIYDENGLPVNATANATANATFAAAALGMPPVGGLGDNVYG